MRRPKAPVLLAGRPLLDYPLCALERAGLEPTVVAKPGSALPALGCRIVREPVEPAHPLVGLIAALEASGPHPVLVIGCDMPFVSPDLLAWMATLDAPLVVPRIEGRLQPLFARCEPGVHPSLRVALAEGAPLRAAVGALAPSVVDGDQLSRFGDPATIAFNVNEPADLERAESMLRGPEVAHEGHPAMPPRPGRRSPGACGAVGL